jgi:hypothetical protein
MNVPSVDAGRVPKNRMINTIVLFDSLQIRQPINPRSAQTKLSSLSKVAAELSIPRFGMLLSLCLLFRAAGLAYLLPDTLASYAGSDCSTVMRLDPPLVKGHPVNYEFAQLFLTYAIRIVSVFPLLILKAG